MRLALSFTCALVVLGVSSLQAQIIYEPVRYQYGGQNPYYYGGTSLWPHETAQHPWAPGTYWGRKEGYAFRSGSIHTHREVTSQRIRVYTDALPYRNAAVYGFTIADAHNEANARIPRYFRKAEMLRSGYEANGMWIVPATPMEAAPGEVIIRPARTKPASRPARPVIVIPKDLFERPETPEDGSLLTRAD